MLRWRSFICLLSVFGYLCIFLLIYHIRHHFQRHTTFIIINGWNIAQIFCYLSNVFNVFIVHSIFWCSFTPFHHHPTCSFSIIRLYRCFVSGAAVVALGWIIRIFLAFIVANNLWLWWFVMVVIKWVTICFALIRIRRILGFGTNVTSQFTKDISDPFACIVHNILHTYYS